MVPFTSGFSSLRSPAVFAALFLVVSITQAQITNPTSDQTPPIEGVGHDYIKMLNETVNPATGSVSIRINVPVPPSRGFTVPFSVNYDSNTALHLSGGGWTDNRGYAAEGGWSYQVPKISLKLNTVTWLNGQPPPYVCNYYTVVHPARTGHRS